MSRLSLQSFRKKKAVSVLNESKSKGWGKLETLVWRVAARYEELLRIQNLVQFIGRKQVSKTKDSIQI